MLLSPEHYDNGILKTNGVNSQLTLLKLVLMQIDRHPNHLNVKTKTFCDSLLLGFLFLSPSEETLDFFSCSSFTELL